MFDPYQVMFDPYQVMFDPYQVLFDPYQVLFDPYQVMLILTRQRQKYIVLYESLKLRKSSTSKLKKKNNPNCCTSYTIPCLCNLGEAKNSYYSRDFLDMAM